MKRLLLPCLLAVCLSAGAQVVVDPGVAVGPVKLMNGVNNGPVAANAKEQTRGNFNEFAALHIPYARTHDSAFYAGYGGPNTVDVSQIFPDFDRDPDDPAAYDFTNTDAYLWNTVTAGTKIFFRLGESIEHTLKKYDIYPPKDYLKWARVCEHIIRHYNEGWANGMRLGIKYWEIWNEPDLDEEDWKTAPHTWGGSPEQFLDFYEVAAKYLDSRFPDLMIGGPALCWDEAWAERFLQRMQQKGVSLDFFSWHIYERHVEEFAGRARRLRALLDKYGYRETPTILDEWNYIKGWTDEYVYSLSEIGSIKGAAFTAAVMCAMQDEPVDMLMYYDFRPGAFNGAFDQTTLRPRTPYYAFYAWNKLLEFGTQVKATVPEGLYACAARAEDGRVRVLVTRYSPSNDVTGMKTFRIKVEGGGNGTVYAHLTDSARSYTEVPLFMRAGEVEIALEPSSFVLIEFDH